MKKYFPVLVSKKGELVALQHLEQHVKSSIVPVIEVLNKVEKKKDFLDTLSAYFITHWNFFGNELILDFSLFDSVSPNVERINRLFSTLTSSGVNAIPAIQNNSDQDYLNIVASYVRRYEIPICIRFSNQSGGFTNASNIITDFMTAMETVPNNVYLLIDLGQINNANYQTLSSIAEFTINSLQVPISEFRGIIVASSSFPESMASINPGGVTQRRFEWDIWNNLSTMEKLKGIKYGDFGTKSTIFADAPYAGTVTLKYTSENDYLFFKGQKAKIHPIGNHQFVEHARQLMEHPSYSGREFCWGDLQYYIKSEEPTTNGHPGSSTNWVQYSQNHHISLIHSLL